jgi:hypothetical protein
MLYHKGRGKKNKDKRSREFGDQRSKENQRKRSEERKETICKYPFLVMHPKSTFVPEISSSHCVTIRRRYSSFRHHHIL